MPWRQSLGKLCAGVRISWYRLDKMFLFAPGRVVAERYRVIRMIARGGMGIVFEAEHLFTEMRVALKVLYQHVLAPELTRAFELEAKVAARVTSDHIVRTFDAGMDAESGLPFLVMELLDGKNLKEIVDAGGPFSPAVATEYLLQAIDGLGRAHEGHLRDAIIHRDIKPENLFLTRTSDGEPVVKILDFGIARVLGESSHISSSTHGTPLFMAPEQVLSRPLGPQTDLWALGLTAFFILTARNYWRAGAAEAPNISALFAEILALPLDSPSQRVRELGGEPSWPAGFDLWFLRCLERDPSRRFSSARDAGLALKRAMAGESHSWSETSARRTSDQPTTMDMAPVASRSGLFWSALAIAVFAIGASISANWDEAVALREKSTASTASHFEGFEEPSASLPAALSEVPSPPHQELRTAVESKPLLPVGRVRNLSRFPSGAPLAPSEPPIAIGSGGTAEVAAATERPTAGRARRELDPDNPYAGSSPFNAVVREGSGGGSH